MKTAMKTVSAHPTDRKNDMKKYSWTFWVKPVALLLALALLLTLCPTAAFAQKGKTVRVGYVNALNYEEGGEGEYKRGAGYEYLQKLSYITGWDYEYVYGTFTECYDMLASGEIDLFGNVSYKPERAEQVDFSSYPQGKDTYWLYTDKNHPELASGDLQQFQDIRIGVTGGSYQEGVLRQWLENNGIQAEVVECKGYDDIMSRLEAGEIETLAAPDLSVSYDCVAIASIGSSDYYFAVSKTRPDILAELNSALYEIQTSETDYNSRLYSRYYYKTASGLALNQEERQWLEDHGNTIRVGYLANNLPFSGQENGTLAGILKTVLDTLQETYGISVETRPYSDATEMTAALRSGDIDTAGPIIRDFYLAEQNGFVLTDAIIDTTPVVIYQGEDYESSLQTIAVTASTAFVPDVVEVLFPEAETRLYATQEECLNAVVKGEAGSTVISSSRINILSSSPLLGKLSFAEVAKRKDVGLVSTKENRRAATIVNKGIEQASEILNGVVLSQHSVVEQHITFKQFLTTYAWAFVLLAAVIIVVLGVLLYRLSVSQKETEEASQEARNANSANNAKTVFLNNMSHDVRTPMNAIIGFTNMALKHDTDPETREYLEKIRQSSDYLLSLLNDVLDISRIESGKLEYNPVPVDITEVTDSVLTIANGFLVSRDLEFRVTREELKRPYVLADELRIRDVLIKIISNAVKFSNDGGRIDFSADYRPGKDSRHIIVQYRIADTGIGMSKEFLTRIFDEFTQEKTDARTTYHGTGLGMAITKRYVEMMGGTITVESQKGVGSTFTVELPLELTEEMQTEEAAEAEEKKDLTGVHVLVVEDNELNAEIAMALLEEMGMVVTRAADGQEAVETFAGAPAGTFDVILMDIMMPRMNGYEATRAIRGMAGRPDGQTIPIIAMTANAFAEDVQASMEAGMNAHLAKPIDLEKLTQTIAKNL